MDHVYRNLFLELTEGQQVVGLFFALGVVIKKKQ